MAKALTSTISSQVTDRDVKPTFLFYVGGNHYNPYLITWNISFDVKFGAASGIFTLDNNDSRFSDGGSEEIEVGDTVELIELFRDDTTQWKSFYGIVVQRSISKERTSRTITLNCLDYISILKNWDIDLAVEGTRVSVTNEVLTPNYLDPPNDDLAQLFNFANTSIATNPIPLIKIKDQNHTNIVEPQWDGFQILYDVGQLKLGYALNVRENYQVVSDYSYYTKGKYIEDVIEEILIQPDGYSNYLFGESTAQAVIDNHLKSTYQAEEGIGEVDTLVANAIATSIDVETTLNGAVSKGANSLILTDATGFPSSGTAAINGDSFTWTGKSTNTLTGIPAGELEAHADGDYVKYTETYAAGQLWSTCVDIATEALTKKGWKKYKELKVGDEILTLNINEEKSEWNKLEKINIYNYDGKLTHLYNKRFDALVTDNHKWPLIQLHHAYNSRKFRKNKKYPKYRDYNRIFLEETKNLKDSWCIFRGVNYKDCAINNYSDEFISLCGWILTEGHYDKKRRRIRMSQSQSKNPQNCLEIRKLLEGSNFKFYEGKLDKRGKICWCIVGEEVNLIKKIFPKKALTLDFVMNLNSLQRKLLIDSMIKGDGRYNTLPDGINYRNFNSTSLEMTENFQILLILSGYNSTLKNQKTENYPDDYYGVSLLKNKYTSIQGLKKKDTIYKDIVWCPSVKNKTWLMRRNGKVCFTGNSYDNITTTLIAADFSIPSNATFRYFDKRFGRLILNSAISITEIVTCDNNYTFKTLQSSGIEINRITFRSREVANRLEAIKKVRQYTAPNYILRTQGDDKIWSSYLNQKSTADYTINLVRGLTHLEDEDLYTRVKMWAKNKQPTNIMFGDDVDYSSDEEDSYTGSVVKEELSYFGEEKSGVLSSWAKALLDEAILLEQTSTQQLITFVKEKYIDKNYGGQASTGKHVFGTVISDDRGKIILGDITPMAYINNVPINNTIQTQTAVPLTIKVKTTTITEGGGKSKSVSVYSLYYYTVIFPHASIVPDEPIYLYDNQGILRHTLDANDDNVDYASGIWTIPGTEQNDINEILSTATYKVLYSADDLDIVYEDVIFKIDKNILPNPTEVGVKATFEYWAIAIAIRDIDAIVDGKRDTQFQLEFFGEPPSGFHLATIDLGTTYTVQAIDIVGGFFKPDNMRKFDCRFSISMEYSTDDVTYSAISDRTDNFEISSGESESFEEEDLGVGFQARYLKFNLQSVDKINYGRGRYVVALTELSVYTNIVLESEATLISTTTLNGATVGGEASVVVVDTTGFTEPESGNDATTGYIGSDSFTYTGINSGDTFTGCVGVVAAASGTRVSQSIVTDTTLYDDDGLLPNLGDRLYKKNLISDRNLYLQSDLDDLTKDYLSEFYKEHTKVNVNILYAPYLTVGNTVSLTDDYNNITNRMYFISSIRNSKGLFSLVLARYPS